MILISAIPLKRGPLYDYSNEHFINPDEIKIAVLNERFAQGKGKCHSERQFGMDDTKRSV